MKFRLAMLAIVLAIAGTAMADPKILSMRERAEVIDNVLAGRVQSVLPGIMRRSDIDMWLIISREYNEDPVIRTFLPSTWHAARRTTILLIYDSAEGQPLETLAVSRYAVGDTFKKAWDREQDGEQWQHLGKLIAERQPKKIAVNTSDNFALADGISHTEYGKLMEVLTPELQARVVSAENIAIGWLETRSAEEMQIYPQICRIAHEILAEGLSEAVIQPGITTTNDVSWWYRERIRELKLTTWFHPSVSVQRAEQAVVDMKTAIESQDDDVVILPGDLIHVDFGITYLRLNTDTQQHAYVLRPGESDAPKELKRALERGNRLQDILTSRFVTGRTGNDILAQSLAQAKKEGIVASIYTHPIGYHGHAAGPTIGMWDQQQGVPGNGDYPMYPDTAYSIELYAETEVAAWGKAVRISLEEDAFFDGEKTWYIDGRQKAFHLIPRVPATQ
ncbi:MAG: aminopeptidase P family protein [Gammaproteobacteria bacterium]|nr:aminopeptidase P family protein [Gammaproteobacteria bacterium]MDH4314286.1 aminopeptidase P family protein [Gammaproteobacteria bacterium]MDH5212758.1 aminopeptidase P family protein [Gammaproteobacteria bacterium]